MGMTEEDYLQQLVMLLPPGPAWSVDEGDPLEGVLRGWAAGLSRVEAEFASLVDEADPRTTGRLLSDWERVAGLPDACELAFGGEQTLVRRRASLLARLVSAGGISRAFYLSVAAALGYIVTITEFRRATVNSTVMSPMVGDAWEAAWRVNVQGVTVHLRDVTDDVNQPFSESGNSALECVLRRLNRAGATLVFNYE